MAINNSLVINQSSAYFLSFPVINYNNFQCINILTRIAFIKNLKQDITNFFKYEIKNGERADMISFNYYGDSNYDWLIFLVNNIVDPYYDWYLSQDDFDAMIINRYGSIQVASETILYYASNWYNDESQLSLAAYTALLPSQRKYWAPIIAPGNRVTSYRRAQQDIYLTLDTTIPAGEAVYYDQVSALDSEIDKNESHKFILLLKVEFLPEVVKLFKQATNGQINL